MEARWSSLLFGVAPAAAILAGCAASLSPGQKLLRHESFEAAAEVLGREAEERPGDWTLRRDHAVALVETGRAADAVGPLRILRIERPKDASIAFQLGRACEGVSDFDGALEAYQDYLELGGRGREEVAARRQRLTLRRIEDDVRRALAREDSLAAVEAPANSIAVPDFANPARIDSLAPLGRGLAAMLITDLSRTDRLMIVERARVGVLLAELQRSGATGPSAGGAPTSPAADLPDLATSAGIRELLRRVLRPADGRPYLDPGNGEDEASFAAAVRRFQQDRGLSVDGNVGPRTREAMDDAWVKQVVASHPPAPRPDFDERYATRAGRLLGARRFVQGSFLPLPENQVQLDAGILDASGGGLLSAGPPVQGPLSGVLRLAKSLTISLYEAFGIDLDEKTRRALGVPPTDDLGAFLAYSRGLMLEDEGRFSEAASAYFEAVARDPSFDLAAERLQVTSVSSEDQARLDRKEPQSTPKAAGSPTETIFRGAQLIGGGPLPDGTGGDPGGPDANDAIRGGEGDAQGNENVEIVIEGQIPGGNR